MQEVFEKMIKEIKNSMKRPCSEENCKFGESCCENKAFMKVIEIVRQAAVEYNNGWIPCSERMPVEHDSIFAKFKGTKKWKKAMFEKTSSVVNVTVVGEKGHVTTTQASTIDGKWSCDLLRFNKEYQIIAWQPLPEPYQQKGEQIDHKATNADRIRSMSDEELAMNMTCPNENGLGEIECDKSDSCNCYECILKWLQSAAEE